MAGEFYVYVLFRPWDGSPFYIGKGKAERWLDHERKSTKHTNKHLASVVDKARRLGLEIPKIKVRDSLAEKDAFEIERALISAMGRRPVGPLVNYTEGGEGTSGWSRGPEWKAKMSRIMTGKPGPTKGRKLSEETRARMRAAAARRPPSEFLKYGNNKRGKPLSDEHKAKLRAAKLRRKPRLDVEKRDGRGSRDLLGNGNDLIHL